MCGAYLYGKSNRPICVIFFSVFSICLSIACVWKVKVIAYDEFHSFRDSLEVANFSFHLISSLRNFKIFFSLSEPLFFMKADKKKVPQCELLKNLLNHIIHR